MLYENLYESEVVHFFIDFQECYSSVWNARDFWPDLKRNELRLIDELNKRSIPTVYVVYDQSFIPFSNGIGCLKNLSVANKNVYCDENQIALPVEENAPLALKRSFSLWLEPSMQAAIEKMSAAKIIISGIFEMERPGETYDCCLSSSAKHLSLRGGFDVRIAASCTNKGILNTRSYLPIKERRDLHKPFDVQIVPDRVLLKEIDRDYPAHKPTCDSDILQANPARPFASFVKHVAFAVKKH